MTQNQINYWKLQEEKRANLAKEGLTHQQNAETQRHNVATEGISKDTLSETYRHNYMQEVIGNVQALETQRHNQAVEGETVRSNRANEGLKGQTNQITRDLGFANIDLGYGNLSVAQEKALQEWQYVENDIFRAEETARHNQATENIAWMEANIENSKAWETARHNKVEEIIGAVNAAGGIVKAATSLIPLIQ
jgi:hypothetical protein